MRDVEFVQTRFMERKNMLVNKKSAAETKFAQLLTSAGLYFVREKCNFKIGSRWCYFDFYIPLYYLYVEIDGHSHDNEVQKVIDKEKEDIIRRKSKYIARFTNDDVFAMESISIDDLLQRMFEYKIQKRKKHRNIESCRNRYWELMNKEKETTINNLTNVFGSFVSDPTDVWMYDDRIGEYFCFKSLAEAKMATGLHMGNIIELLDMQEYKQRINRAHIFAYSKEDCIRRVYQAYGW